MDFRVISAYDFFFAIFVYEWYNSRMTRILAIDPSSNRQATSTTGIVLLNNTRLIDYWVVPYGVTNFLQWWHDTGIHLEYDIAIVEKFIVRHGDGGRDNSVTQTVEAIKSVIPEVIEQSNMGYGTDVPDSVLKACGLWSFEKSHHQDVRAAARLALFYAMRNDMQDIVNEIGDRIYNEQESLPE